jgi:hypothetical protein
VQREGGRGQRLGPREGRRGSVQQQFAVREVVVEFGPLHHVVGRRALDGAEGLEHLGRRVRQAKAFIDRTAAQDSLRGSQAGDCGSCR